MKKVQKKQKATIGRQDNPLEKKIPSGWAGLALFVVLGLSLAIYLPTIKYDFLNWDDDVYVTTASNIKDLSPAGIKHIFTSFSNSNYHPLTTLSYALLYDQFGADSGKYHLFNIILHLLNTILVFILLYLWFPRGIIPILGSAIFALHPMHIESVAWISETKDLLYTAFLLLSMIAYSHYSKKLSFKWLWYLLAVFFGLLSSLSKSAAAILPLLLLLYDWFVKRKISKDMWWDKVPFFLLAIATGILAIMSQQADKSINMAGDFPLLFRLFFASYGLWFYAIKFVFPFKLSALHYFPNPAEILPPIYYIAGLATVAVIIYIIVKIKKSHTNSQIRITIFGLGFYVISLLMVLQLIPIGRAIVAERYTYLSYLGLIMLAGHWLSGWFGIKEKRIRFKGRVIQVVTLMYLIFISSISFQRIPIWENSITLFDDVIRKYPDRAYAYMARGNSFLNMKDPDKAMADYNRAIARDPNLGQAYYRRATLNYAMGKYNEAIPDFEKAVALLPNYAEAWNDRGSMKYLASLYPEALADFRKALEIRPDFPVAHKNAALALYRLGRIREGRDHLTQAISLDPGFGEAYYFRGIFQWEEGKTLEACSDWEKAKDLGYEPAERKLLENCSQQNSDGA